MSLEVFGDCDIGDEGRECPYCGTPEDIDEYGENVCPNPKCPDEIVMEDPPELAPDNETGSDRP